MWGSAFPGIKLGYQFFQIGSNDIASQILFAGLRFALSGVVVFLWDSLTRKSWSKPAPTSWKMIVVLAVCQTILQHAFFYIGLANTSGVRGAILAGSNAFFIILVACLVFRYEKITRKKTIGCLIGFAGVVLINLTGDSLSGAFTMMGEGFVLLSALAIAFSSSFIKLFSGKESPIVLSAYSYVLGGAVMIVASILCGGRMVATSWKAYVVMIHMVAVSAIAYTLSAVLIKYNHISKIAVFNFATPLFGAVLSALILQESRQIAWFQCLAALILVCLGIFVVNYERTSNSIPSTSKETSITQ